MSRDRTSLLTTREHLLKRHACTNTTTVVPFYFASPPLQPQQAAREDNSSGYGGVRRFSVPPAGGSVSESQANGASILGQRPLSSRDRVRTDRVKARASIAKPLGGGGGEDFYFAGL